MTRRRCCRRRVRQLVEEGQEAAPKQKEKAQEPTEGKGKKPDREPKKENEEEAEERRQRGSKSKEKAMPGTTVDPVEVFATLAQAMQGGWTLKRLGISKFSGKANRATLWLNGFKTRIHENGVPDKDAIHLFGDAMDEKGSELVHRHIRRVRLLKTIIACLPSTTAGRQAFSEDRS